MAPNTFYAATGAVVVVGIIALTMIMDDNRKYLDERAKAVNLAEKRLEERTDAWTQEVKKSMQAHCKLTDDVTGLYSEKIKKIRLVGKVPESISVDVPKDVQIWECEDGVRYWSTRGTIPNGFVESYASILPKKPTLAD